MEFTDKETKTYDKKRAVVFDFDCTLTDKHWWKGIYMKRISGNTELKFDDDCEKLFVDAFKNEYMYKLHISPYFMRAQKVFDYVWGGEERLKKIKGLIKILRENDIDIMISTNGQVGEVMGVLSVSGIEWKNFRLIHGCNDNRKSKIAINIANMKIMRYKTFKKAEFITQLKNVYTDIVYIDDDSCEYKALKGVCTTVPLEKESGGITDKEIDSIYTALGISVDTTV